MPYMRITSAGVKDWLANTGKDSKWLATQCGVEIRTVYNWLSTDRGIPAKAELIIDRLMKEESMPSISQTPPPAYVTIPTTLEEYLEWEKTALNEHKTLTNWVLDAIRAAYLAENEVIKLPKAAEEPGSVPADATAHEPLKYPKKGQSAPLATGNANAGTTFQPGPPPPMNQRDTA